MTIESTIRILRDAAASLEPSRRDLLEYTQWRRDNVSKLDAELTETEPFQCLREGWLFTGDGSGHVTSGLCGEWAANQLLSGNSPETIIANAKSELAENVTRLFDVSPVFGAKIEREIVLGDGIVLIPAEQMPPEWESSNVMDNFVRSPFDPRDCCALRQDMIVSPAFVVRSSIRDEVTVKSVTEPSRDQRQAMRIKVRAAMLLSCNNAIELPFTTRLGPPNRLLVGQPGRFGLMVSRLPSSVAINENRLRRNFDALDIFNAPDALVRAVDRLGRSRIDTNPTDSALDLGIAAEILLMHETSSSNTEITYKLASRAAWLVGHSKADRLATFDATRDLYKARSDAVHHGRLLNSRSFDQQRSDELVRAAIEAILLKGDFPDWKELILGEQAAGQQGAN